MHALLTIGVLAKLRVRALDERWTRLFVSKFFRLVASSSRGGTGFCKLGGMAASGGFLKPDRKITRRKRGKRIQYNVHRIGVAGEF
jgi:hypothetical protein